jgi:hypothetical protein
VPLAGFEKVLLPDRVLAIFRDEERERINPYTSFAFLSLFPRR